MAIKKLLWFFLFLPMWIHGSTFKDRLTQAQVGDYIVMEQNKILTLLSIHTLSDKSLILEEICIPSLEVNEKTMNWKKWVQSKAPNHTSWTMYEIDLKNNRLLECFSFSKQAWLAIGSSPNFLISLIALDLTRIPPHEQKKIGPPPISDEEDRRKVWAPVQFIEGKKIQHPSFDVLKIHWPSDGTELAEKELILYFDHNNFSFPFPYWMQINDRAMSFVMRSIDSGKGMLSPYPSIPRRSPEWIGPIKKEGNALILTLKSPPYFSDFNLYAIDLTAQLRTTIALPFQLLLTKDESLVFKIDKEKLEKLFIKGHHYNLIAISKNNPDHFAETSASLLWN